MGVTTAKWSAILWSLPTNRSLLACKRPTAVLHGFLRSYKTRNKLSTYLYPSFSSPYASYRVTVRYSGQWSRGVVSNKGSWSQGLNVPLREAVKLIASRESVLPYQQRLYATESSVPASGVATTDVQKTADNMAYRWTLDKGAVIGFYGFVFWHLSSLINTLGLMNGWLSFLILWGASSAAYMVMAAQRLSPKGKAIVITGCDTGFGNAMALHLESLGFRVFAGCLFAENGEGAQKLRQHGSDRLHVIQMDVTSEKELQSSRKEVEKLLPKDEVLWGVVNNAGLATFGELEWVGLDAYRKILEVNLLGTIAATQTFLPLIRRAKGRVITVASMLGRMGAPLRSPYVASKYGVEGVSDCLRFEMKSWGVRVAIIEPGNFIAGTNIFTDETVKKTGERLWSEMKEEVKSDYGEQRFQEKMQLMKGYVTAGSSDLSLVSMCFEDALLQKYPQSRYQPMELGNKMRVFVNTHLPEWVFDNLYGPVIKK